MSPDPGVVRYLLKLYGRVLEVGRAKASSTTSSLFNYRLSSEREMGRFKNPTPWRVVTLPLVSRKADTGIEENLSLHPLSPQAATLFCPPIVSPLPAENVYELGSSPLGNF